MPTTSEYLQQLQTDKQNLVDNLVTKGVSATSDETFTELVPKVLDIQSGGSDFVINDATYLFAYNSRLDILNDLLTLCKNVGVCSSMFFGSNNLTSVDLSNFDTSECINFANMFQNCDNLTEVNVSNFDTSKVMIMSNMFRSCSKLTKLDISSFSTESLIINTYMFYQCTNLKTLIINNPKVFKITDANAIQGSGLVTPGGGIYVPDNLVDTYKSETNWSEVADYIKPISELPEEA